MSFDKYRSIACLLRLPGPVNQRRGPASGCSGTIRIDSRQRYFRTESNPANYESMLETQLIKVNLGYRL